MLKYANLRENLTNAIEIMPKDYYKNIIVQSIYNRKEKYIAKNKTRKTERKCIIMSVLHVQRRKK